ncbi:hypothetical protein MAQ58_22450, partial [Enterobacter sp. DRP3]|nr:hypothetical protein [Enterobacter sp. DRP3]
IEDAADDQSDAADAGGRPVRRFGRQRASWQAAGIVAMPVDAGGALAIGVALAEGLATLPLDARMRVALKWPNDLLLTTDDDGTPRIVGKLAGILIETVWTTADATAVVIGFGINVRGAE